MAERRLTTTRRPSWSETDAFVPRRFVRPFQRFMHAETSGAIIMLVAAIAALVWANSPWYHAQESLWETPLTIHLGDLAHIDLTLVEWINDALMAIFFFLVGLEIKREMVHGELRDPRKAALPVIAALGGMIVPAGIYMLLNAGEPTFDGWGVPMATDIAFAVAVVALVGDRVPASAKVFLLTLAIADDMGAILVIALFYTSGLSFGWLAISVATIGVAEVCKRLHIRAMPVYIALALFAWFAFHETGIHATLAGVILGLLTPAWPFYNPAHFSEDMSGLLAHGVAIDAIEDDLRSDDPDDEYDEAAGRLAEIDRLVTESQSPLDRLSGQLELWVAFVIVPLFAFANAGVRLSSDAMDGLLSNRVVLGIAIGLVVGKTVGVFTFTLLGEKLGLGTLPAGVTHRNVFGLALTAGVGFTVALFVAGLAFEPGLTTDSAKIGILAGSLVAGILGYTFLRMSPATPAVPSGSAADAPAPALVD
ncbi:MAG TPA: Na+/H+ antiporter NhaA [Acidimicrobiales bacterium]|nr:Na+/H+ antiporter NhaA [Acidimicrobiales bacterium]